MVGGIYNLNFRCYMYLAFRLYKVYLTCGIRACLYAILLSIFVNDSRVFESFILIFNS